MGGLTGAIENSWVFLMMRFGIVGFIPFVACFGLLIWRLWVLSPGVGRLSVLMFFCLVTFTPTLGIKSTKLTFLALVAVCAAATAAPAAANAIRVRRGYALRPLSTG